MGVKEQILKESMINQEEVKKAFYYDGENLVWKIRSAHRIHIGDIAGTVNKMGYISIKFYNEYYYAHRLIWLYVYGEFPPKQIDHINGNSGDNRVENLRCVSQAENTKNRMISRNNTSGVMGVSWCKAANKYQTYIDVDGKRKPLGLFKSIIEASKVRREAEIKYNYHPNHGRLSNDL